MSYLAGHHRVYYSPNAGSAGAAVYLGETRKGIRWGTAIHRQHITSDRGGKSRVSGIEQGNDTTLTIQWIEYNLVKLAMKALTAAGAAFDTLSPYSNVGHLTTTHAGPLYAVPVSGTPAETEAGGAGKCYCWYLAIPASNFEDLLSSDLREGPMTFECYPDPTNSDKVWDRNISNPAAAIVTP